MNQFYTIGQLAALAGISVKTLRVYERKGLLLPERNEDNGYRIYGSEAVKTLEKIQLMKYLDLSLDQIAEFLQLYENVSRENMLLEQKRLLENKKRQLDTVISHIDRAIGECHGEAQDGDEFLRSLGLIVRNRRADEVVVHLMQHADEPRGWSRFIFDCANLKKNMRVLDAGAGYGNLWRYNLERLPQKLQVLCVDKHNTHMDTFADFIAEQEANKTLKKGTVSFAWDDLETMNFDEKYHRIFFNHVVFHINDRMSMYEKFAKALAENGAFICTWGGMLFYEKLQPLLHDFLEDCSDLDAHYKKHTAKMEAMEKELNKVFSKVEKHAYVITLHFATAEEFMEFIQHMCRPVRDILEHRRDEFLLYLKKYENEQGLYSFERDTLLYSCSKEV